MYWILIIINWLFSLPGCGGGGGQFPTVNWCQLWFMEWLAMIFPPTNNGFGLPW